VSIKGKWVDVVCDIEKNTGVFTIEGAHAIEQPLSRFTAAVASSTPGGVRAPGAPPGMQRVRPREQREGIGAGRMGIRRQVHARNIAAAAPAGGFRAAPAGGFEAAPAGGFGDAPAAEFGGFGGRPRSPREAAAAGDFRGFGRYGGGPHPLEEGGLAALRAVRGMPGSGPAAPEMDNNDTNNGWLVRQDAKNVQPVEGQDFQVHFDLPYAPFMAQKCCWSYSQTTHSRLFLRLWLRRQGSCWLNTASHKPNTHKMSTDEGGVNFKTTTRIRLREQVIK